MTKEEWKRVIAEQSASGQSALRFCRERGISDSALSYWRKKLTAGAVEYGSFARVDSVGLIAVELPGGKTVRVGRADLPAVLEALCGR